MKNNVYLILFVSLLSVAAFAKRPAPCRPNDKTCNSVTHVCEGVLNVTGQCLDTDGKVPNPPSETKSKTVPYAGANTSSACQKNVTGLTGEAKTLCGKSGGGGIWGRYFDTCNNFKVASWTVTGSFDGKPLKGGSGSCK